MRFPSDHRSLQVASVATPLSRTRTANLQAEADCGPVLLRRCSHADDTSCTSGHFKLAEVTSSSFNCEKIESASVGPTRAALKSGACSAVSPRRGRRCDLSEFLRAGGRCNRPHEEIPPSPRRVSHLVDLATVAIDGGLAHRCRFQRRACPSPYEASLERFASSNDRRNLRIN